MGVKAPQPAPNRPENEKRGYQGPAPKPPTELSKAGSEGAAMNTSKPSPPPPSPKPPKR